MTEQIGIHCGERSVSYPELLERVARAARGLNELGVGSGDRVALLLGNDIAFVEATLAAVTLAANAVPINWHWKADEIGYLLRDSQAKVLVAHADLLGPVASAVPEEMPVVLAAAGRPATAASSNGAHHSWDEWTERLEPWAEAPEGTLGSIIYSSGTTGRPKGIVRMPQSEQQRTDTQEMLAEVFHIAPGARTVVPAPLYHAAPNVFTMGAVRHGMDITIMPRFDAEELLRLIEARRIDVMQVVPTHFVRMLALPQQVRDRYDLSSLRWIVHAAAPCPPEIKRAMIDWLGPIISEYYGCTESGAVVFCDSEQWLRHPGTVGKALPGARVKILGEDGRELGPGEVGDVYVRLDAFPDFTYQGDDAKRRSIERDGLFTCGDIGYLDEDGFLYLSDRRVDMVISGGVNIYPAEIEACLMTLAGVRDCAVFGIPDDEFGEALAAHIDAHPAAGLTPAVVREHVGRTLASYKVPRVVELVSELPREDSGKIFKRWLREPYWAGRERRI